ncbi:hypothetical protein D3C76_1863950 [compost metagenome]
MNNPTSGVMAGTLYMAGQIEGNLAASAEPPVGLDARHVEWQPSQSTNQQINP